MICKWLASLRAEKVRREYLDGYDWAAGCLLRGEVTVEAVHDLDLDPTFAEDNGIADAFRDWTNARR